MMYFKVDVRIGYSEEAIVPTTQVLTIVQNYIGNGYLRIEESKFEGCIGLDYISGICTPENNFLLELIDNDRAEVSEFHCHANDLSFPNDFFFKENTREIYCYLGVHSKVTSKEKCKEIDEEIEFIKKYPYFEHQLSSKKKRVVI